MKKWIVHNADEKLAAEFMRQCDLSMLTLKLLTARGFCDFQQVADFFNSGELEDPFIIADMQNAADTINEYIDSYGKICVYGDYDCDGVTATAVLYSYLLNMGANVCYYINQREEGYGMNLDAVRKLHDDGVELIVTVDNGISCVDEAELIYELGMKLVITDHHQPPEVLPKAEAAVNPHREDCPSFYKDLAGVGVALKLCAALDGGDFDAVVEQYADICAIGTVGDLVPLTGENRTLVRKGLMYLKNSENYALNELIAQSKIDRDKITSSSLAYQLCPRINAAGRFESPLIALEALLAEEKSEAVSLVDRLVTLNEKRKQTEAEIYEEIKKYIDDNPELLNDRVLILAGKNWHHGVIGIVSSKVLENYGKPNFIISIDDEGNARGSARSFKGFNIHSCLTYAQDVLEKYGGHECAGGLSLNSTDLPEFRRLVLEYAANKKQMPCALTECDMLIRSDELDVSSIKSLDVLQPFGVSNPQPVFYLPDCKVNAVFPLSGGKHSKLDLSYNGKRIQALVFSVSPEKLFFGVGAHIDIAAHIEVNDFGGKESLSIKVRDMKPHGMDTDKYHAAKDCYERFAGGELMPQNFLRKMIPQRQELIAVYKTIAKHKEISIDSLFMTINHPAINYCKLKLMTDVFCQAGLAEFSPSSGNIHLLPANGKADLENTEMMRYLNGLLT